MGKFNKSQNTFSSGEVSARSLGNVATKEYNQSLERLESFIPLVQGGVTKCPGFQFVADLANYNFVGKRIIPFSFSKDESYAVILSDDTYTAGDQLKIYRTDGTEASIDEDYLIDYRSLTDYTPTNWNYTQSGDIIFFTYSSPKINEPTTVTSIYTGKVSQIAPFMLLRTGKDAFTAITFTHPDFLGKYPAKARFSPAVMRPYLDPNIDPDIRFYVDNVAIGAGRTLYAVDSSNNPVPFFTINHCHLKTTVPTWIGAFFKIQKSGTEGVCYGEDWWNDLNIANADINTATDILTETSHGLETKDEITLLWNTLGTAPVISGYSLVSGLYYGDFFVRKINADTFTLHPTLADASANTNIIDITSAGTSPGGFVIQHKTVHKLEVTIEVALEATANSAAGASDDWQESAWSAHQGFPNCAVFHEQRLFTGGYLKNPDRIDATQVGNIFNFMARRLEQDSASVTTATTSGLKFVLFGDVTVTDPLGFNIASRQANIIQWMESQNVLLVGTLGSEYTISGGDEIISNSSLFVKKQTDTGSNSTQAISYKNSVLFCSRDGKRINTFLYNRDNGSYKASNLNFLADHIVYKGSAGTASSSYKGIEFKDMAYQPSRSTVWLTTTRDELVGVTLSEEVGTASWFYRPVRSGDSILSIAVLPNEDGTYDELWATVQRNINGVDEVYLEKMGDDFEHEILGNTSSTSDDTPFYSDSSIAVTLTSATNTVTLPNNTQDPFSQSHLEGETVKVLAGGEVQADKTVSSGSITLDSTYSSGTIVVIGLPYTSTLQTPDIEGGSDFGSSQGNRQRIDRVAIKLYKSQKGSYGNPDQTTLFDLEYDDDTIFSGVKRLDFKEDPQMENKVKIVHDDPVPFTILNLTYRGVSYD